VTSRLQTALQSVPQLADVASDQETRGLQATLVIDRVTAARLGVTPDLIDSTLGNAFGRPSCPRSTPRKTSTAW